MKMFYLSTNAPKREETLSLKWCCTLGATNRGYFKSIDSVAKWQSKKTSKAKSLKLLFGSTLFLKMLYLLWPQQSPFVRNLFSR